MVEQECAGSTASEWLSGAKYAQAFGPGCVWMDPTGFGALLDSILQLKALVIHITESHLLD